MGTPLQGCGIIITRPAHQSRPIEQRLITSGAAVLKFPLLEIAAPNDLSQCAHQLSALHTQDCVIFTSANAVKYALNVLTAPLPSTCDIAAVGKKTAQALCANGMMATIVPDEIFNSEALLALPALQQVAGQRISIVRGTGGRELLKDTLRQRGAIVTYIDVYQRRRPVVNLLPFIKFIAHQALTIILITSEESLINLFEMTLGQIDLNHTILLLGSQRIADSSVLTTYKGEQLISADPSDESIYNCLLSWANKT